MPLSPVSTMPPSLSRGAGRTRRLLLTLAAVALVSLGVGRTAQAGIIQVGGTYTVEGTNFRDTFSKNVTLDGTAKAAGLGISLVETIIPDGPNAEWVDFTFRSDDGGPLAGNINATWRVNLTNLPMSQPALLDGLYYYWTVNGTAVNPIFPFGGFSSIIPHPVDPSLGPVYGGFFPAFGPFTELDDIFAFASPYSFIGAGGMNPNTANDFHVGMHLRAADPVNPIPEPSSLALLGAASLGLLGTLRRRLKRQAS